MMKYGQKKTKVNIKINNWDKLFEKNKVSVVKNLEELDDLMLGVIPKMLYHYEIHEPDVFVIVPSEFENGVRDIVETIVVDMEEKNG